MANITIDGKQYAVRDGVTIIEAIDQIKADLPRYCYHPGLSIAGNCRICQVEVEKMPRTVIACNTRVAEGMIIHTKSTKAKESQQVALEFLLANHPLDCPVCDQAGECKLQDYYMDYGLYNPAFDEGKVKKTKKAFPVGPTILLDQERCILCSRCVRFTDEVTKTHEFGIFNRGDHAQVDVYPGTELNNKYSGNVADICPVGALTDRDFRFKLRVWYLGEEESVCPGCSRGCNIEIHFEKSRPYHLKEERVMRLKPRKNADVNQWWMCDEGRYGYKSIDFNRLKTVKTPQMAANGRSPEASWLGALESIASALKTADPSRWAVLASPQSTNEELFLVKRLFRDHLKIAQIAFHAPGQDGFEDNFLMKKDKNPNTSGASAILGDGKLLDLTVLAEKAKRGELEGLFVFHHDLGRVLGAKALAEIRARVKTLIFEGPNENSVSAAADYVLAGASYAEKDGTFTNFEGRIQRIRKAIEPLGASRPTWSTLLDLGALLGWKSQWRKPETIFAALAAENAAFKGLDYKLVGSQGRKAGLPAEATVPSTAKAGS